MFKFKDGAGVDARWEGDGRDRAAMVPFGAGPELWAVARSAFVYRVEPVAAETESAADFLAAAGFAYDVGRRPWAPLGATPVAGGLTLFGLYHPTAARVSVTGDFNGWQPQSLRRFVDVHGEPGLWLATLSAAAGSEYRFLIEGGTLAETSSSTDPFARRLGPDYGRNNALIIDSATLGGPDPGWDTPLPSDLILYELSPYGFTEGDQDVTPEDRGTFRGITRRIEEGHFDRLGVTALSLMPLAETPSPEGPTTLGYNPSLWTTVGARLRLPRRPARGGPYSARARPGGAARPGLQPHRLGLQPALGPRARAPRRRPRDLLRRRQHAVGQPCGDLALDRPGTPDRDLPSRVGGVRRGRLPL